MTLNYSVTEFVFCTHNSALCYFPNHDFQKDGYMRGCINGFIEFGS